MRLEYVVLLLASFLAAVGQLFLKLGATDRKSLAEMINWYIAGGLVCYALGAVGWIYSLSKLPLKVVYPYTTLTLALVYVGAVYYLGEKLHWRGGVGIGLVLVGLYLLTVPPPQ